eukprot:CAMPEP_0206223046 /NCGR_PEP_ID=MMETSP0047_2-20121206/6280_1 /ASSEMBLY_ACC=CAM_ASM_000192 /TAXON_ID=195065 /ORGANISM="Chroomonas mesostigmatica_cf, Strain CCMP1168" /LENGTH=200 /DNA_ID=CAMNT_0053645903 /DNA_START=81 /DNA_END=683 /DNA_ORIENTATION=+
MGVDIDPSLILKARSNLRWKASSLSPDDGEGGKKPPLAPPQSVLAHKGGETRASRGPPSDTLPDPDEHPFDFPYNCGFRREDFVESKHPDCTYDCVLALSITKWVHFNGGDAAIKAFFRKVFESLSVGGVFVLEWQEWSSYKKKKSLTPEFKKNCAEIQLKPDMFEKYLLKEVGFRSVETLQPPESPSTAFSRPLQVFLR